MSVGLLLIDCQEKLFPKIHHSDSLKQKLIALIKSCEILNIPILTFEQYPSGLGKTIPELRTKDQAIEKMSFSCVDDSLFEWMEEHEIDELIIAGIETHVCVYQSALALMNEEILTTILADATGSRNEIDASWALSTLQIEGCQISTVERFLFEQLGSAEHVAFRQIQQLIVSCG